MAQTANFIEALNYYHQAGIPVHGPQGFGSDVQKRSDEAGLGIHPREPEFSRVALHTEAGRQLTREILLDQFQAGAAYVLTPTWVRDTVWQDTDPSTYLETSRRLNSIGTDIALSVQAEAKALGQTLYVGGDIGPILDSHAPKIPDDHALSRREIFDRHYEKAQDFIKKGVGHVHFETISTGFEGLVVVDVAERIFRETGVHSILSFTPKENGLLRDDIKINDVTRKAQKSEAIGAYGANCIPIEWIPRATEPLMETRRPVIIAPNGPGEHEVSETGNLKWKLKHEAEVAEVFAKQLLALTAKNRNGHIEEGATIASACCGTTVNPHGVAMAKVFEAEHNQRGVRQKALSGSLVRRFAFA